MILGVENNTCDDLLITNQCIEIIAYEDHCVFAVCLRTLLGNIKLFNNT